jgi:hypothetical protein
MKVLVLNFHGAKEMLKTNFALIWCAGLGARQIFFSLPRLIQKDGGIGPDDVLATLVIRGAKSRSAKRGER